MCFDILCGPLTSFEVARAESFSRAVLAGFGHTCSKVINGLKDRASRKELTNIFQRGLKFWCGRGDSNPYALRRHPLKMVRLPVPPLPPGVR